MSGLSGSIADAWKAPRLGLSGKKMWVVLRSLLLALPAFVIPAYAAWYHSGYAPLPVWNLYRFFPPPPPSTELGANLLWNGGCVLALFIVLIGATGVARITYRQFKGDNFYGRTEGWRFALAHGRNTLGAPFIIGLLLLLTVGLLALLGAVAAIPAAGPIVLALSLVPAFFLALFGIYLLLALGVSFLYAPAIVGCTGEDAIEGAIQTFSLLWTIPWRTAVTTGAAIFSTAIAGWVLVTGALIAWSLMRSIAGGVMGSVWNTIEVGALTYLPFTDVMTGARYGLWPEPLVDLLPTATMMAPQPQGLEALAAFLAGIALLLVLGVLLAYLLSSLFSGLTAGWLVLRRNKDGEDLLAWQDDIDLLEDAEPAA